MYYFLKTKTFKKHIQPIPFERSTESIVIQVLRFSARTEKCTVLKASLDLSLNSFFCYNKVNVCFIDSSVVNFNTDINETATFCVLWTNHWNSLPSALCLRIPAPTGHVQMNIFADSH